MRYRSVVALALGLSATFVTNGQPVYGQRVSNQIYGQSAAQPRAAARGQMSPAAYAEELPPAAAGQQPEQQMQADPFSDDAAAMQSYGGVVGEGGDFYCDSTCNTGCTNGPACANGQWYFTADYLYVRASFSEAVTFMEVDNNTPGLNARDINQFDFEYDSSYRFGGGYRLCECGDQIRFMYTRFDSFARDQRDFDTNIIVPFEVVAEPGGQYFFNADVDLNAYDLEYAKTIPLGGKCGCGCGDACGGGCGTGCGDCYCEPCCPAWDITWSGGIRAAEADWERSYWAVGATDNLVNNAVTSMDFDGVGAKIGLEGRRYFFNNGWLSMYMKGDLSLLYGNLEFEAVRTEEGGSAPDSVITQTTESQQLIPVTELEAGLSGQVSCHCRVSAGYLLSAWHDLGFRDQFQLDNVFPLEYDDANILGFDGFFARMEFGF